MMNQKQKLKNLLGIVGLLRARFSTIMKTIHDFRQTCKTNHSLPPGITSELKAKAQDHFAELLKAGAFVSTALENTRNPSTDTFNFYLEDWIITETRTRMKAIASYVQELKQNQIRGMEFDPQTLEDGETLVQQALELLKNPRKN